MSGRPPPGEAEPADPGVSVRVTLRRVGASGLSVETEEPVGFLDREEPVDVLRRFGDGDEFAGVEPDQFVAGGLAEQLLQQPDG